jgi:hypothetical protein
MFFGGGGGGFLGLLTGAFGGGSASADAGIGWGGYSAGDAGFGLGTPYHKGGIVGETKTVPRVVNWKLFENAPRFHRGLNNDEVAAILKKRETVLTEEDVSAIKSGLMKPGYSYNVGPIVVGEAEQRRNRRMRSEIDKTIRRVLREAT